MLLSEIEKNAYSLLPTIPFLVICPRETLTQVEKGSHKIIFFSTSFVMVGSWKGLVHHNANG